ncbi:MAG: hypothetical protein LUD51_01805 [Clostridia bacterium]|nr:hypothetical protein [Clostridia bacterium]
MDPDKVQQITFRDTAPRKINKGETGTGTGVCEMLSGTATGMLTLMAASNEYSSGLQPCNAAAADSN